MSGRESERAVPRPAPGTPMIVQWRKWDGSPHWRHECIYLGADAWGDWVGQPEGFFSERPGASFHAECDNVTLLPAHGADYASTLYAAHPRRMEVYIDLGAEVGFTRPDLAEGIDMDLDVVRVRDERGTWVDDRDEWAEHSVRYGYPAEVMTRLEGVALDLERRVRAEEPPFDAGTAATWLRRLRELRGSPSSAPE